MEWFQAHLDDVLRLSALHLYQAVLPLLIGVLIALPVAQLVRGRPKIRGFVLSAGSLLYTIPSLALFVTLPAILGTRILDMANIIIALTIYAVALMLRVGIDAFDSVDDGVRQAAVAMGYRPLRRFLTVDLPLSVPVLIAGLRVVSVSNISIVSVGALIGVENLGFFFSDGLRRYFVTEIVVGILATLVLALVMDMVFVLLQRSLTPWLRAGKGKGSRSSGGPHGRSGPGQAPRPAPLAAAPEAALKGA
ncbi:MULTISPECIES: ABC transporter permease [unclassified Arthrobacter]|uniref:ABC transporter permease n=1 Tax=unclassified Arthrobacter TaxID=235627 RepID=UPI001D1504B9|nr:MULTISPECIES: ABC transporter permease [unclassified Arthrobacter]MCC3276168.1 ABC transporter permease [Arthrobacter sp. zg-Y20]MCC3277850.1 ABC transporter permease [Arthrobacter sp. zg-Y40]MCC9176246.1 ABC transporter permease [Arthrobacter sp. zg-Y750]MDK1316328.1 ABC transporter permease [Arthrobacter sp. zg.Y20]WIB05396.1 ABC transporter permease [Arthrobacter sp. zg-Y20]